MALRLTWKVSYCFKTDLDSWRSNNHINVITLRLIVLRPNDTWHCKTDKKWLIWGSAWGPTRKAVGTLELKCLHRFMENNCKDIISDQSQT